MKKKLLVGAVMLGGIVLAGCGGYGGYYDSYGYGPPPPRYYGAIGVAPGPGYVWAPGWWDRHGHDWAWRDGRWVRPPHGHSTYIAPEWRREGHGYRYRRGYWR